MTERFEIPPGRCRQAEWTAGACAQCAYLSNYAACWAEPSTFLRRYTTDNEPIRRTDGKCPHGDGPIPVVQGTDIRKAPDKPMTLREYDAESLAPLKYGPPTGGKP